MFRFLRIALFAAVVGAMSVPAFAIHCSECDENGNCVPSPDSGTICHLCIDCCWVTYSSCVGVADQEGLADTLAIASVEVATPPEVTKVVGPRITEQRPVSKAAETLFKR